MSGIFGPIYWTEFSWESFAALFTGITAVGGAIYIGKRQTKIAERQTELLAQQAASDLKLRQQTLRMELLERRADCIQKMRRITDAWFADFTIDAAGRLELSELLEDAKLLYPDALVMEISDALSFASLEAFQSKTAEKYIDRGDQKLSQIWLEKSSKSDDKLEKVMRSLLGKMVAHTRIFDWDDQGNGASRYDGAC